MPDRLLRHAMAVFYSLALIVSAGKSNLDIYFVSTYIKQLQLLYGDKPMQFSNNPTADINPLLNTPTILATVVVLDMLYALLAAATIYFLYFHKFDKN